MKVVDPRIEEILDRLSRHANEPAPKGVQRERRWPYRKPSLTVNIEHPGGGFAKLATHPISIWCEGIQLLFAGFAYPGSACTIVLLAKDGEPVSTRGVIVSCKHVEKVLHCAELKFEERIDPHIFVDAPKPGANDAGAQLDLPNLYGKILHIDDSEFDAKLLAHHLRGGNIELKAAQTPAQAKDLLSKEMFDIILCDLNLGAGHDSTALIRDIRAGGFLGPIVIVSAEDNAEKLAAAKAAGAEHSLAKPYAKTTLLQTMIDLHREVGAIAGDVLYSTLADQLGTDELLAQYVTATRDLAKRLMEKVVAKDFQAVREYCLNIKGSAPGYGFAPLGQVAEEAIKLLDSTNSIEKAKPKLRLLMLICQQLGLRNNSATKAA